MNKTDWFSEDILSEKAKSLISQTIEQFEIREFTNHEVKEFCSALTSRVEKNIQTNLDKSLFKGLIED